MESGASVRVSAGGWVGWLASCVFKFFSNAVMMD